MFQQQTQKYVIPRLSQLFVLPRLRYFLLCLSLCYLKTLTLKRDIDEFYSTAVSTAVSTTAIIVSMVYEIWGMGKVIMMTDKRSARGQNPTPSLL